MQSNDIISFATTRVRDARAIALQTSYKRRWPGTAAELLAREAIEALTDLVRQDNSVAIGLASEAHEILLEYETAAALLRRTHNSNDKQTRKKLAYLDQESRFWSTLGLSPKELHELGVFLHKQCDTLDSDPSRPLCLQWGQMNNKDLDRLFAGLDATGAYSDVQVLSNVV